MNKNFNNNNGTNNNSNNNEFDFGGIVMMNGTITTKEAFVACKILRVIYTILKTGTTYDPQKLLKDIKHPAASQASMAA